VIEDQITKVKVEQYKIYKIRINKNVSRKAIIQLTSF